MGVFIDKIILQSQGFGEFIDLTLRLENFVSKCNVENAILNITNLSSSSALITMEDKKGLSQDINAFFEKILPLNQVYNMDLLNNSGNAFANLRTSLLNSSLNLAVQNKKIQLGYKKIILIDFNNIANSIEIALNLVN